VVSRAGQIRDTPGVCEAARAREQCSLFSEEARLHELEAVVSRGLDTFVEVGTALCEIRDSKLYRQINETFESYCRDQWGMSRAQAYRMIEAAGAVSPMGDIPGLPPVTRERQARELAAVPEPDRVAVYRETVERTGGKPTAKAIREVREERATPAAQDEVIDAEIVEERVTLVPVAAGTAGAASTAQPTAAGHRVDRPRGPSWRAQRPHDAPSCRTLNGEPRLASRGTRQGSDHDDDEPQGEARGDGGDGRRGPGGAVHPRVH
jgi:hypothetical protein